jgi:hypothetical protein
MSISLPEIAMAISLFSQSKINKHSLYKEACKHINVMGKFFVIFVSEFAGFLEVFLHLVLWRPHMTIRKCML